MVIRELTLKCHVWLREVIKCSSLNIDFIIFRDILSTLVENEQDCKTKVQLLMADVDMTARLAVTEPCGTAYSMTVAAYVVGSML